MSTVSVALVTGASGFIGRSLVARLQGQGTPVAVLTRQVNHVHTRGARVHVGDLATGRGISSSLFEDVGCVFHCAGEVVDPRRMRAVHVDGTARLLDAASGRTSLAPMHWVQLSSVGAYGPPPVPSARRVVDEESPEAPRGVYEETKTASDRLVRQASGHHGLSISLLRPTAVIGATMPNASVRALVAMVRRGWFMYPGPVDAVANYVHVDDVVSGLLACANHPRAAGQDFILSSDCLWTALVSHVAVVVGVRVPTRRLPNRVVRTCARIAERLGASLTVGRVDALSGRTTYASEKIQRMLELRLSRPLPDAVRDVIEATS